MDPMQNCLADMKSAGKVADRRNAAQRLEALLGESGECQKLDIDSVLSEKKEGNENMTWNRLFQEVSLYFSRETEKGTITGPNKATYFSIVQVVFVKATRSRPWLHWQRVHDFIVSNLEKERQADLYGPHLINMLERFLSVQMYLDLIDASAWIDLIKVLIKIFGKYKISSASVLNCLRTCIAQGSLYSDVIPTLRYRVVNFYRDIVNKKPRVVEEEFLPFIEGVTTLCKMNACEFRSILCKFGEDIIPSVLSSNSLMEEQEAALVEFLLVQCSIHMPLDVEMTSVAFYTSDVSRWKDLLQSMYSFCVETLEFKANRRSRGVREVHFPDALLTLAAKCTKHISSPTFLEGDSSEGEDEGVPPKKKMRFKSFKMIIGDISRKQVTEATFVWLQYLSEVMKSYPELVETKVEYADLTHIAVSLFSVVRHTTRFEFYAFLLSLLKVEKHLRELGILTEAADTWISAWEVVVKSLPITADRNVACALLRQILIEFRPSNVNSLLSMYLNGTMPVGKCTVELLAEFLSVCAIPTQMKSTSTLTQATFIDEEIAVTTSARMALIKWLVKASSKLPSCEPLLATVMCSLAVKQSHALVLEELDLSIKSQTRTYEFETVLLQLCFVQPPQRRIDKKITLDSKLPHFKYIIQDNLADRLAQALQVDLDGLPSLAVTPGVLQPEGLYQTFMSKLFLYMNVLNIMEKYSIGQSASLGEQQPNFVKTLERIFCSGVQKINDFTTGCFDPVNNIRRDPGKIKTLIEITRILFSCSEQFCDKVRDMLIQQFSPEAVGHFKLAFRSNLARYIEASLNNYEQSLLIIDDELPERLRRLTNKPNAAELDTIVRGDRRYESMSLVALRLLVDYGLICGHKLTFFNELLRDLCGENFCNANLFLFDACSFVVPRVAKLILDPDYRDFVGLVNGILQKCCRHFYKIPKCAEKIWKMMKAFTPVIAPVDDTNRRHFMILVGTTNTFLKPENSKAPPLYVYRMGFETLAELAKHDISLKWTFMQPQNITTPLWVLDNLPDSIANKSRLIRMWAIDAICAMFENALPYDYTGGVGSQGEPSSGNDEYQKKRKNFLENLYNKLVNTYDVEAGLSTDENHEESVNRTGTVLSCLTRLIFAFPYTTKKIVMFLFLLVKLKNIDVAMANRALEYASPNALKTVCCHLPYVLKQTLALKQSVTDLPFQLFGCHDQLSFYRDFMKEICAELFQQSEMANLQLVAAEMNESVQDLVSNSYGLIMARLTPALAILHYKLEKPQHLSLSSLSNYNTVYKDLIDIVGGKDTTDNLLSVNLGDVILNLISLTFEPSIKNTWKVQDIHMTEPMPPHHSETIIEKSLKFLQSISSHEHLSVIGFLAQTSHQSIYKILLTLMVRIHDAHDDLEKYWRLHHFSFFVNLLLNEPPEIFSSMKEYTCSFIFNTYLRLLKTRGGCSKENQLKFQKVVIFLLKDVVVKIIDDYTDEMLIYFGPIIRAIVSAVDKSPDLAPSSKEILDFMLKTHGATFAKLIEYLDPFPSAIQDFYEYSIIQREKKYGNREVVKWSLTKEFEALLQQPEGTGNAVEFCTKERLLCLRHLLSSRKRDLDRMVRSLETKRFSEECASDPLHGIIQMLIGVALSGHHEEELVIEACRCLGEIGPVDLSVLVLPPYKRHGRISDSYQALLEIVQLISGFLKSDDIVLVTTAGKTLKSLLEYKDCSDIFTKHGIDPHFYNSLKPFHSTRQKISVEKIDATELENKLGLNEMNEAIDYRKWLSKLTIGIIECFKDSALISHLVPLCEQRVDFCDSIFPYLVYLTLYSARANINVKRTLGGYFRNFFGKFATNSSSSTETARSFTPSTLGSTSATIYMNKLALRCLIRAIQFLRRHSVPNEIKGKMKPTPWDSNFWIEINYLDVARAAQYCGAYLTSIMYIEIAATQMEWSATTSSNDTRSSRDDAEDEFYSQGVCIRNRNEAAKIERLLLKAYSSIGEGDAAYGCGSARFSDSESSMHHMAQTMDWHRLLMLANGSYVNSDSCYEPQVALSMKQLGIYNVLWEYLKGVQSLNMEFPDDLVEVQYECGWRLTKWDLDTEKPAYIKDLLETSVPARPLFQMCVYESIQSGLIEDKPSHLKAILNGFKTVHRELRHATLESSENIYGFLSKLQMLRVIEDFFEKTEDNNLAEFKDTWRLQDKIPAGDFKYQEPALFVRNVLLREYVPTTLAEVEQEINTSFLELITRARDAGRLDYAESCATAMASVCSKPSIARELEVAKNNWARGGSGADVARSIMSKLIKKCPRDDYLYPSLLLLYGDWLSITHCERPSVILESYLKKSCTIYESKKSNVMSDVAKAYVVLAKYADAQYQNVTKYMNSDVFQAKVTFLKKAKAQERQLQLSFDAESKKSAMISTRHSKYDEEEITHIRKEQKNFLELALKHYLRGLKTSNENDLLIFRAISLWLENEEEMDTIPKKDRTTEIFGEEKMPSYKYIVVLHQLSARLSKETSTRNSLLREILSKIGVSNSVKCAEDHPFHTLPVLLTQANLHKDENLPSNSSSLKVQLAGRVEAAAGIVTGLKKSQKLSSVVSKMETLWLAMINLANFDDRSNSRSIPSSILKHLKNLSILAVPTCTIPVLQSGNYKDSVVHISRFENTYSFVGGINSPKKLKCVGSNGVIYNMLLKGQDDLRQDAVMQQVFGVMNKLLQVEPKTRVRRLHIRTYRVIPLSQRTGLIEWVENTQTLGEYLTGNGTDKTDPGAHGRYRPNDYKPMECRKMMLEAKAKDFEARYTNYAVICEHLKPVFRHFFFENFKEAGVFFEKRLAYTRSVATNSIVGYILGLGDRHVLNILIDKTTAEFIHIDLGVAFEQGRILPTPETVPFRLTRDVVDGMGVSGVDGVFRRSCEMTMEVLRNNSEIILTVLQVLLYDPLYMWALTNDRVAKVQPSGSDTSKNGRKSNAVEQTEESVKERNNSAMRVLLRLRQKLMGIEEEGGATGAISSGSSLSIEGHVALLIQRAIDPEKLCRLFPGWQPYL